MADSASLLPLPSIFTANTKPPHPYLSIHPRPVKLQLFHTLSSKALSFKLNKATRFSSVTTFVAQTSDWAQEEEKDNATITLEQEQQDGEEEPNWEFQGTAEAQEEEKDNATITLEQEQQDGEEEPNWEYQGTDETQANLSDWEPEGEDTAAEAGESEGESAEGGVFEEEEFVEPPEDAKLFVGNLPYDIDSEKLAMLFEKAGTVEIAEVIYNRETDRSRGFGFVTLSTVEEAEQAVEMFNGYVSKFGLL